MGRTPPSRVSRTRILADLRAASRKGDRAALTLAVERMRTLALSPRYWEKYLVLLRNPLARLVDLLVIRQGDRIAQQKGWKLLSAGRRTARPRQRGRGQRPRSGRPPKPRQGHRRLAADQRQATLFEL